MRQGNSPADGKIGTIAYAPGHNIAKHKPVARLAGSTTSRSHVESRGLWCQIRERQPRVNVLTQPATHYDTVMTRNNREPVMVGETI